MARRKSFWHRTVSPWWVDLVILVGTIGTMMGLFVLRGILKHSINPGAGW